MASVPPTGFGAPPIAQNAPGALLGSDAWNDDLVKALQGVSFDAVTIHDYSYSEKWVC